MRASLPALSERFAYWSILVYAVSAPFGTLVKISSDHRSFGLSTAALLSAIMFRGTRVAIKLFTDEILLLLMILVVLASCASIQLGYTSSTEQWSLAWKHQTYLAVYIAFAAAVSSCRWTPDRLGTLVTVLATSIALSSIATLVDHMGMMDLPRINESRIATWVDGEGLRQAAGPFGHRTAMAGVIGVGIIILLAAATIPNFKKQWLCYFSALVAFITLLLSHNRAAPVAVVIVVVALLTVYTRRPAKTIGILFVSGLVVAIVIQYLFPEVIDAYSAKLAGYFSGNEGYQAQITRRSDSGRVEHLVLAVQNLASWPIGHGFSYLPDGAGGWISGHSIPVTVLGAVGFLAFPLFIAMVLLSFARYNALASKKSRLQSAIPFMAGVGVWMLIGLVHDLLYFGLGYICLGILLALSHRSSYLVIPQGTRLGMVHHKSR